MINVGGILGAINEKVKLLNCYNEVEISSFTRVAGTIETASTSTDIINCYNT